jgi:hypothetical protein
MSVKIPSSFDFGVDLDVDLDVSGIPTNYTFNANVAPLNLSLAPIKLEPVDFTLRLRELPAIRAHLPLDYRVGLTLLGAEVMCVRLCGQGQVITEPYVANPCEAQRKIGLDDLHNVVTRGGNG